MTMTADPGHVPLALPLVVVFCLSATFVYVVHYLDIGLPVWGTCVTISVSLMMTLALGYLVGTSGQNLAFPSSILTQLLFGFLLPGNAKANIAASAINNAITSQSLTLFNDYRTAILLAVRPRDMLAMQLWGTFLGLICSVLVYDLIMTMEQQGKIHFNKGVWANLGASGAHLNGEVFGTFGLGTILSENPSLKAFTIFLFITGIIAPLVRRRLPDRIRPYFPDTVLIGVSQFVSSTSFSCMSALIVALFYQHYLRYRHTSWYKKYQMVSTSGMNMGVGIGGIVLLILTSLNWTHKVDIGGPAGDGCHFTPTNMPQF